MSRYARFPKKEVAEAAAVDKKCICISIHGGSEFMLYQKDINIQILELFALKLFMKNSPEEAWAATAKFRRKNKV